MTSLRLIIRLAALAVATHGIAAAHAGPPLAMTEVAAGVFVHGGVHEEASPENNDAIANIGFVLGDDAVAVIDPGGSALEGDALRAAIRALTDRPIRYVILTHVHPDHIFGAAAFRDDNPDFVGHAKLPGALAQRGGYYLRRLHEALGDGAEGSEIVTPTLLVSTRIELDLGGRRLVLHAHGPAHTDSDLTIFDDKTRTLWLSDLLFVDRIPVVDGSLVGWLKELESTSSNERAYAASILGEMRESAKAVVPALTKGMSPGLSFSSLTADFVLHDGQATTSDLHFDGDAEILVRGRTGLLAQDYDEQAWILRGEERLPAAVRRLGPTPRVAAAWLSLRELFNGSAADRSPALVRSVLRLSRGGDPIHRDPPGR